MMEYEYEGTYLFLVFFSVMPCTMLFFVRFPAAPTAEELKAAEDAQAEERSLNEIFEQPFLRLSVSCATIAQCTMVMFMSGRDTG